jgi:hypothetical protein
MVLWITRFHGVNWRADFSTVDSQDKVDNISYYSSDILRVVGKFTVGSDRDIISSGEDIRKRNKGKKDGKHNDLAAG